MITFLPFPVTHSRAKLSCTVGISSSLKKKKKSFHEFNLCLFMLFNDPFLLASDIRLEMTLLRCYLDSMTGARQGKTQLVAINLTPRLIIRRKTEQKSR